MKHVTKKIILILDIKMDYVYLVESGSKDRGGEIFCTAGTYDRAMQEVRDIIAESGLTWEKKEVYWISGDLYITIYVMPLQS